MKTNDDLLFGIPNDLDEAVEVYMDYYRVKGDISSIKEMSEVEFNSSAHLASGQFLRNSWYLWWVKDHSFKTWPATIPPIVKFFNEHGITHADDMSAIIITSVFRRIKGIPVDFENQVSSCNEYWKKQS